MILHRAVLLLAFVGELLLLSAWQRPNAQGGSAWNPLWLFLLSMFIGLYPILAVLYGRGEWEKRISLAHLPPPRLKSGFSHPLLLLGLAAYLLVDYSPRLIWILEKIPIAVRESDILPQIRIFVSRFLVGEFPYQPITEFGYHLFSPYMPLQWGPYIIPRLGHFDERWLSLAVFALAGAYFCWRVSRSSMHVVLKWMFAILPFWVLRQYLDHDLSIFAKTVELLIAGYYLFFATTLLAKSPYVQALGMSLCLLSRYFLVFWVPVYLLSLFVGESRRKALLIGGIALAAGLVLFVFPFYLKDPSLLSRGMAHHQGVMLGNWSHDLEAGEGALFAGVGFAGYFAPVLQGEVAARLGAMSWIHLLGSLLTAGILGGIYWRIRRRISLPLYAVASLKIYLTVFYTLLPLPVLYYFFVPLCVSLPVLLALFDDRNLSPGAA